MVVRHFDSSKEAVLLTDASRLFGLGYALGHMETDNAGKKFFQSRQVWLKGVDANTAEILDYRVGVPGHHMGYPEVLVFPQGPLEFPCTDRLSTSGRHFPEGPF